MLTHSKGLWRIEYQTDLSRSDKHVLPLGYVLEARWSDDVRWLGMLFRRRLSPLELEHVDLETWHELKDLEPFMNGLFENAWSQELGAATQAPSLGAGLVASRYPAHSSLQFNSTEAAIELGDEDPEDAMPKLYKCLLGLHDALTPTLVAPVLQIPRRAALATPALPRADVEHNLRAA